MFNIHGFQKMTMLDFPGKVACTAFTAGCNFRCPFCHNASLVTKINNDEIYSQEEIFDYLNKRKGVLDGVCITGGEPLLYDGIVDFIKKIRELGLLVKLDTNGSFPEKLKYLIENGLVDYVAMDIKNSKDKYAETIGLNEYDISNVEKSVALLLEGKVEYEFRTTIVEEYHTPQDIVAIGEWIKGAKRYFLQNFVDSGNLIGSDMHGVSKEFMKELQIEAAKFVEKVELRGI